MSGNLHNGGGTVGQAGASVSAALEQGRALAGDEALRVWALLADQVCGLHEAGWLHRGICGQSVSFEDDLQQVSLSAPSEEARGFGPHEDDEQCPPELRRADVLEIPRDLAAARKVLAEAGVAFDPVRIDIYQLGTLLCRMLSGESIGSYLRSPRAKGNVPPHLQPLIERAVGYDTADRFTEASQLAQAARSLLVESQQSGDQADSPAEEPLQSTQEMTAGPPAGTVESDTPNGDTSPSVLSASPEPDTATHSGIAPNVAAGRSIGEDALPFQTLGHYEIVARIGHGGMGDVYKGYERVLDRTVAIKVLPSELSRQDDFVRRFYAEATAAAKLIHPNIIQIHFIGEDAGHHFFAMQYVDGESLADVLSRRKKLGVKQTLAIIEQSLAGLAEAHQQGMVHRDIKPGNLLLDRKSRRVLLADFGLVKMTESTGMTATGVIMGTVDYISPEQGRGQQVDGRSDLYALGVLMYQMLSGRLPFEAESPTALIFQHVYEQPKPLRELDGSLPEPVAALVAKLLSKSPEDRHQTAEAVLADLRAIRKGRPLPSFADVSGSEGVDSDPQTASARPATTERDSAADVSAADVSAADVSAADVSAASRPQTVIFEAPQFDEAPLLPAELDEEAPAQRWGQLRNRLRDLFQQHAPEFVKELQTTQHQVDGAVAEYERRRNDLQQLVGEAEAVLGELQRQAKSHRTAAARAQKKAEAAPNDEAARAPLREKVHCVRLAKELETQFAEQRDQLESMQLRLSQVNAKLQQLISQRDLLSARLKAAHARVHLAGGKVQTKRPRWHPAAIIAATALLVVVGIVAGIWIARVATTGDPDPIAAQERLMPLETTGTTETITSGMPSGSVQPAPLEKSGTSNDETGKRQPGRVLIDASKGGGAWWFPQSPRTEFDPNKPRQGKALADYFKGKGWSVHELPREQEDMRSAFTRDTDVVVRYGEFKPHSANEAEAYRKFVEAGGSLILLMKPVPRFDGQPDRIAEAFGVHHETADNRTTLVWPDDSVQRDWLGETPDSRATVRTLRFGQGKVVFVTSMPALMQVQQPFLSNILDFFGYQPAPPKLISPAIGAVLDNGSVDRKDGITWQFDWSDVPGATNYHLWVMGDDAAFPVINREELESPEFRHVSPGSYIIDRHRRGWRWKVRAKIDGQWQSWSQERTFDVQPLGAIGRGTAPSR